MVKQAMIVATLLSAAVVAGFLGLSWYQQNRQFIEQSQEFTDVKSELAELRAAAKESAEQAARLQKDLTNSQSRIEALIKEKEAVTRAQSEMENQMRATLESKDVTISELQGKLTLNILDRILFASGEAELKPEGQQVLGQIASVLMQHTNRQIYVIGHTDNIPFRGSAFSRYTSNWELSTARATSAVRYLTEAAGVDPRMLAAVGYGEFHPVADNSTVEGRAKNRRIEIVILPEQFNPVETPPGTNNPPSEIAPATETDLPPEPDTNTVPIAAPDEEPLAVPVPETELQ